MDALRAYGHETFASLKIRNYRLYFIGQGVSLSGTWMQTVAMGWLMLELTGSGVQLGSVLAMQYLPVLVGGFFAGSVVDRFNKRKILFVTQAILAVLAFSVSALVATHAIHVWMLYVFSFLMGAVSAVDNPARQTFVHEMVGPDHVRNAVTLLSTIANMARAVGPLVAGMLIAGAGIAFCFFVNALSFVAIIFMLFLMRPEELHIEQRKHDGTGQHFFAVLQYVRDLPDIKRVLISMAVIGTLSYEFPVSLPLVAQKSFHGDASVYATLLAAMGIGSVVGGLYIASKKNVTTRGFTMSVILFGFSICMTAAMPTLILATIGMVLVGYFSINLSSAGNTILQLSSAPHMRGRVMSLWSMAIFGSTLIGAPIVGFVGEHMGARYGLVIGGVAAIVIGALVYIDIHGRDRLYSLLSFKQLQRPDEEFPKI